ncbi:hypothetical protein ONQ62_28975, partial [Salmonella enterica subsp. enterica serovar Virginia]|nr:hypothetical protein [Salmonella enterica subsp. enterica serovar Virginia]
LRLLRTRLTMVFQHFNLWSHMTVLENVMEAPIQVLGLSKHDAHHQRISRRIAFAPYRLYDPLRRMGAQFRQLFAVGPVHGNS